MNNLQSKLIVVLVLFLQQFAIAQQPGKLVAKIPFESSNGTIILSVKINDSARPLRLLFDTGADGMAVSQALADAIGLKVTHKQNASVVGGSMEIQISRGNDIHLGDFVFKNQSIAVFKDMGDGKDGIIGNAIARNYITKVDYDKKELSLYEFGDYQYEPGGTAVPITNPDRLFIIPATLSIKPEQALSGNFVFDSGAGYSLICFRPFVKQNRLLVSGFKPDYNSSTTSMGMSTPTFTGKAASFSFAKMPAVKNMPLTLMAAGGQSEDWNPGFEGSIGIRLISRYDFTINMHKKEIYFKPNHTFNYPNDFAFGGFLFAFTMDGDLEIGSMFVAEDSRISLKQGSKIKSINGISAKTLLKDKKQLDKLLAMPTGSKYIIESTLANQPFKDTLIK